uniref:hypothetical protein n=1 Tax=Flavobacterium sp. TaxID=239 RepID=UPI00404B2D33
MKKKSLIIGILGIFFLVSCGPRRYGCGPNRRCEIKLDTTKTPLHKKLEVKNIQNS